MGNYTDDFYQPPEQDRPTFVEATLNRVGVSLRTKDVLGGRQETPGEAERKAREAAERLARRDRLFGVTWGCTIGVAFTAGDPDADGVDDADLASMDQARR